MAYKDFIDDTKKEHLFVETEIYELTLGWLMSTPNEQSAIIKEIKDLDDKFKIQLIKEIAEDAKQYDVSLIEVSEEDKAKAKAKIIKSVKVSNDATGDGIQDKIEKPIKTGMEKAGEIGMNVGNKVSAGIDKLQNVPMIKSIRSKLDSAGSGFNAAKASHSLGADPSTSAKIGVKVFKAKEGIKGMADKVGDAKDAVVGTTKKVIDAAKENSGATAGIAAAGLGAGLGALALAKKLRKGKEQPAQ